MKRDKNLFVVFNYGSGILVPEGISDKMIALLRQCEFVDEAASYNPDFPCPAQFVETRFPRLEYKASGTIFSAAEYEEWKEQKDAFEKACEEREQLQIDKEDVSEVDA